MQQPLNSSGLKLHGLPLPQPPPRQPKRRLQTALRGNTGVGMKKVLIVTTISGFLAQFEMNDVDILKNLGCEICYASNFRNPVYAAKGRSLVHSIRCHGFVDFRQSRRQVGNDPVKGYFRLARVWIFRYWHLWCWYRPHLGIEKEWKGEREQWKNLLLY